MKAIIQLPDDFEKGCCSECPFSYEEWIDYYDGEYCETDVRNSCVFGYNWQECEIEVQE